MSVTDLRAPGDETPPLFSTSATYLFFDLVGWRVPASGRRWIERINALIHPRTRDRAAFAELFATTTRQLGEDGLALKLPEMQELVNAGVYWSLDAWSLGELGRVVLLLIGGAYLVPEEFEQLVEHCYWQGDSRERQAVLRALPLLPSPQRFHLIAHDASRSPVQPIFEALACDNPFAALYFSAQHFEQLALRVVLLGLPAARIVGLDRRWTPSLGQLAETHARENPLAARVLLEELARLSGRGR